MMSDAISKCVPSALQIVLPTGDHFGPVRDPAGFSAAVIGRFYPRIKVADRTYSLGGFPSAKQAAAAYKAAPHESAPR